MGQQAAGGRRDRLDAEEWSRFWQRGNLTTFEGHFRDNYDAEIRDFWWAEFARLADGACIVDLATGNGAVALLAAQYAREHAQRFHITGVDSATIEAARVVAARPALAQDLAAISLRGGGPLEAPGLEAGSAHLVTSQYGFEYGDTAAGSVEAARILAPGGRLAMVVHHDQSAILAQAKEGLAQVAMCLNEERFVRLAPRMVKLFRGLKPGRQRGGLAWTPGAEKVRDELMAAAGRLERHARQPEAQRKDAGFIEFMVPAVLQLLERSRALSPQQLEQAWREIEAEAETYRLRMADLVSAARSEAGIAELGGQLAAAGMENVAVAPLSYGGGTLLGWTLTARKP